MFFLIAIIVFAIPHLYVGWRLIGSWKTTRFNRTLAWMAAGTVYAVQPVGIVLHFSGLEKRWIDAISWIGFVLLGLVVVTFVFLLLRDLIWWVTLAGNRAAALGRSHNPHPPEVTGTLRDPERRRFIVHTTNMGVLALSGGLTGYGVFEARRQPAVKQVRVPLVNLPKEFDGYSIVQITDLHVGPTVKRDWVEMVVEAVNALKPDLIAFTGDLVDGTVAYLQEDTAPMGDLRAPDGVYFITGNHEYYSGVEPWIAEMRRLGLDVLLNEHRIIERGDSRIVLAGVTDWYGGGYHTSHRSDPKGAIANAPSGIPRILLAHQPRSIYDAAAAGYDLQISGHTHGGQFFPGNYLARLFQPYIEGLHRHENTWVYVSRGTGYWGPPVRIGQPSEVTRIVLDSPPHRA